MVELMAATPSIRLGTPQYKVNQMLLDVTLMLRQWLAGAESSKFALIAQPFELVSKHRFHAMLVWFGMSGKYCGRELLSG